MKASRLDKNWLHATSELPPRAQDEWEKCANELRIAGWPIDECRKRADAKILETRSDRSAESNGKLF